MRKALKRKKKEKDRGIVDLVMVMHHFFKELPVWIEEMEDPRHPSYITYSKSLSEMPHSGTLNYYLERLSPNCLSKLRKKLIKKLIRMKSFYRRKLLGQYWRVIMDGTGLFYFKEKHCDNCLVKTVTQEDGTKVKTYYHKVLEAKLVLSEKIVISLDTEFIENEKEDVSKRDCEINAAK